MRHALQSVQKHKELIEFRVQFVNTFLAHLDKINSSRLGRRKMLSDSDFWPWKYHAQYFTLLNSAMDADVLAQCDGVLLMKKILHFFRSVRQRRMKQRKKRMSGGSFGGSNNSLTRMVSTPVVEILSGDSTESSDQDQMMLVSTKENESEDSWGPHILLQTLARVMECISPQMWCSCENEDVRFVLSSMFLSGILDESSNPLASATIQPYVRILTHICKNNASCTRLALSQIFAVDFESVEDRETKKRSLKLRFEIWLELVSMRDEIESDRISEGFGLLLHFLIKYKDSAGDMMCRLCRVISSTASSNHVVSRLRDLFSDSIHEWLEPLILSSSCT